MAGRTLDDEAWPDETASLLRFGECRPEDLAYAACKYAAGRGAGVWGLSAWWWPGLTPGEIARQAHAVSRKPNGFPHKVMRMLPRDALYEFDFLIEIRKTYGPGHYTIQLPSFLLDHDYEPSYDGQRASFPAYVDNALYFDGLSAVHGPQMPNPVRSR